MQMEYRYVDRNLKKHGITRSDVDEVLAVSNPSTRDFEMELSADGNLQVMFIGFTNTGRLLEVAVEFLSENQAKVFHGQVVSPQYRDLYEETIANE
jgi:hypothetical protein